MKMKDLLGLGTQEVLASGLAARLGKKQAGYERQGAHMLVGQDHAGGRLEHPVEGLDAAHGRAQLGQVAHLD